MANNPITDAILAEANEKANEPYSTSRKIKGFLKNKFHSNVRSAIGGSTDGKSVAKVVGRNLVSVAPKALGAAAKHIPVVGSYAGTLVEQGSQLIANKVVNKLDTARESELRNRSATGSLTVKEMTEMIQKAGDIKITQSDIIQKMQDAVRKVDQSYAAARDAIVQAKDCDSIYKAAKNYAYLKYRVVRLQYYIETIRAHLDEVSAMNERYGAQIIGFEADLVEIMDQFFSSVGPEYHTANCKNKSTCYYQEHGIV